MSKRTAPRAERPLAIITGSGNVFADLGLGNADERQLKAGLLVTFNARCSELQLSQQQLVDRLCIPQSKVSTLRNFKASGFSAQRLLELIARLGFNVDICVAEQYVGTAARVAVHSGRPPIEPYVPRFKPRMYMPNLPDPSAITMRNPVSAPFLPIELRNRRTDFGHC